MPNHPPQDSDALLRRIADALDRLAPPAPAKPNFNAAEAFVWRAEKGTLAPVVKVNRVDIGLLRGVDRVRDLLVENTERFARGLPANNALLWGARGMGKSSLVKAAQAAINREPGVDGSLKLVEIHREDIEGLPALMILLRDAPFRFIVFCDDLSFDAGDASYKSLKAALEGGVEGRPANVLFYATSNRRHLMPREMMENERVERHQSGRGGRGKGVAFRSVRPVARFPPLQPGRLSRHGAGATPSTSASTRRPRRSRATRWNGRRRGARARAAPPGSSSRIWRDDWGSRSEREGGACRRNRVASAFGGVGRADTPYGRPQWNDRNRRIAA